MSSNTSQTSEEDIMTDFLFPIDLSKLRNEKVRLVPFERDFAKHVQSYVSLTQHHPELYEYLPSGPYESVSQFEEFYYPVIHADRKSYWFTVELVQDCVMVKPGRDGQSEENLEGRAGEFCGVLGLLNTEMANSSIEIGHLNFLPKFQRTFLGSNAIGLVLLYLLDPAPGGLGFRRVEWKANAQNVRSVNAAKRLGFHFEGILRFHRVLREAKKGSGDDMSRAPLFLGERKLGPARHTALLSICWDDWLNGGREKIKMLMDRQ